MVPKFDDPAQLKIVNGKFILATNDPTNPVSLIRQKTAGNDTSVIITLSNGDSYDDTIQSVQQLVEVTSNKKWGINIEVEFELHTYGAGHNILTNINNALIRVLTYSYCPTDNYYLPTNHMIPKRFSLDQFTTHLDFCSRSDYIRGSGLTTLSYSVISPPEHISAITDLIAESLIVDFRQNIRGAPGLTIDGRNIKSRTVTESDSSYDLVLSPASEHVVTVTVLDEVFSLTWHNINHVATLISTL